MNILKTSLYISALLLLTTSCTKTKEEYYPNGRIKSQIEYRFGKENGKMIYYDENYGTKTLEITMKKGKKEGKLTRYFANGNMETEATYKNDILEGKEIVYDIRGNKIVETTYLHGVKNGPYISWHEKDMIREKGNFLNDKFDSQWLYYDERGFLVGEGNFSKGNGILKSYDGNGNLSRQSNYKNNFKNGPEIYFAANGDTIKIVYFQNDRIIRVDNKKEQIEK